MLGEAFAMHNFWLPELRTAFLVGYMNSYKTELYVIPSATDAGRHLKISSFAAHTQVLR
jgi:hypothetical protein